MRCWNGINYGRQKFRLDWSCFYGSLWVKLYQLEQNWAWLKNLAVEAEELIAFHCLFAKILWRDARWLLNVEGMHGLDIKSWLSTNLKTKSALNLGHVNECDFLLQAVIIIDVMWFAQNKSVHCGKNHHLLIWWHLCIIIFWSIEQLGVNMIKRRTLFKNL